MGQQQIKVNVEGLGTVNFPADYTPDRIQFAIENDILPRVAKQSPQPAAAPVEKPGMLEDVAKSIPGIIPRAVSGVLSLPENLGNLAEWAGGKLGLKPERSMRDLPAWARPGDAVEKGYDAISNVATGSPLPRPQTGAGRIVDAAGQALVAPGAVVPKLVMGASGGVAAEGARLVTDNPVAITVLSMLGAGAGSLPFILRSVPAANINAAIKDLKPQDLAAAQKLMDDAKRLGTPLTGAEAIAQVTGKNTLQDIQRVVESSKQGGPVMQPMMNARPDANRAALTTQADTVGAMPAAPSRTPVKMQQAAEGSITDARQAGNAAAKPFYDAARTQKLDAATAAQVAADPALRMAINKVIKDPLNSANGLPADSVGAIDAAKKYLDDIGGSARLAGKNELGSNAERAAGRARAAGDAASPDYTQARAIVAKNRQDVVNPMQESPVGDIANTKGLPAEGAMRAQGEILMPQAPRALDPMTIRKSVATLNAKDPDAARDFVRQNVQAIFDEAAQNLSSGKNQAGAAKFASQIAGNPRQKDNLQALVESVSDRQTWNGFNRMLEVFEAQGKRQAPGSQTAQNLDMKGNLSAGGGGAPIAAVASPNKAMSMIGNAYDNFRFGKNTEEMARILTDPKSVDLMRQLAKEAPNSAKAAALTVQILSAARNNDSRSDN